MAQIPEAPFVHVDDESEGRSYDPYPTEKFPKKAFSTPLWAWIALAFVAGMAICHAYTFS